MDFLQPYSSVAKIMYFVQLHDVSFENNKKSREQEDQEQLTTTMMFCREQIPSSTTSPVSLYTIGYNTVKENTNSTTPSVPTNWKINKKGYFGTHQVLGNCNITNLDG